MEREIIVGTSGYSFDDWKDVFYPERLPRRHWLPHYARYFGAVEINSSYYAIPKPGMLERMARITPEKFRFVVKLPGEVTHKRDGDSVPFREFEERIREIPPEKLDGLLAQFPFSFKRGERNEDYLAFMRENLPAEVPVFVEFRHRSWDDASAEELLEKLDMGWVSPDEPDLPQLMSRRVSAAGDAAYLRLHSRDAGKWWSGGGKLRYDYDYGKSELGEIVSRIHGLPAAVSRVFVFFNNCHGGSAVRNALAMKELLGQSAEPRDGQMGLL